MFLYIVVTQKNSELVKYRPHQEIEFARVSDKWYSNLALKTEANFLLSVLVVVIADVKYKCKKLLLLTYFIRLSFNTMDVKYQKRENVVVCIWKKHFTTRVNLLKAVYYLRICVIPYIKWIFVVPKNIKYSNIYEYNFLFCCWFSHRTLELWECR